MDAEVVNEKKSIRGGKRPNSGNKKSAKKKIEELLEKFSKDHDWIYEKLHQIIEINQWLDLNGKRWSWLLEHLKGYSENPYKHHFYRMSHAYISAGPAVCANHDDISFIEYNPPSDLGDSRDRIVFKVLGDSMINIGIYENDKIFVKYLSLGSNHPNNGDVVAVRVGENLMVKTFYRFDGLDRLYSENDKYDFIEPKADEGGYRVIGVVESLLRTGIQGSRRSKDRR
jgi:hypothetical protein